MIFIHRGPVPFVRAHLRSTSAPILWQAYRYRHDTTGGSAPAYAIGRGGRLAPVFALRSLRSLAVRTQATRQGECYEPKIVTGIANDR